MNRKIFTIFFIAVFLIVSAGVISAADDQDDSISDVDVKKVSNSKIISVKVIWDDASKASNRPNEVKVNLIKDGAVVDTVTLNELNSWKATFKAQSDDGSFKVKEATSLGDYSVSVTGNADSGFTITNKISADVLAASEDETPVKEDASAADVGKANEDTSALAAEDDNTNDTNSTGDNATDNSTDNSTDGNTDNETTDNETDDTEENADDGQTMGVTSASSKNPVTKEKQKVKTPVKKSVKKNNVTKAKLKRTGIPLAILVVVAFGAAFVPFSRKK